MAIGSETLAGLAGTTYGPVVFTREAGTLVGAMAGRSATIALDGPTVCVRGEEAVAWPRGRLPESEVDDRVGLALVSLALARTELLELRGDRGRGTASATLWLDAGAATVHDLAVAVRTVAQALAVAREAVRGVAADLASQEELLAAAESLTAAADVAIADVERALAGETPPAPPPPAETPPVSPPGAPTVTVSVTCAQCGATLAPGVRFCAACGAAAPAGTVTGRCRQCGAELRPSARFCAGCGTAAGGAA